MNSVKKITIQLCIYLLIGITGILIANKAVFLHFHKMADGSIVAHAHPYNKSAGTQDSHHHSAAEIVLLDHVNLLFPFLAVMVFAFYTKGKNHKTFSPTPAYHDAVLLSRPGRSPPH